MIFYLVIFNVVVSEPLHRIDTPRVDQLQNDTRRTLQIDQLQNNTRRILRGKEAGDTKPFMVYLRPASSGSETIEPDWLCGGVIIDERYILTSAACIEEVKHFYVVSGTNKWVPGDEDNECIKNGQKKAVWKCVPRNYVYDGEDYSNIRWMMNDIAVVKVEDPFNFDKKIKGCDFIPKKIAYNNQSADLEKPKSSAFTAGWGSTQYFSDVFSGPIARTRNEDHLLEAEVQILSKKNCKSRWHERYHHIIDKFMICGKDSVDTAMSAACDREVKCIEIDYQEEEDDTDEDTRRVLRAPDPKTSSAQSNTIMRRSKAVVGGFCENDHGGPLVVGHGTTSVVIGIISANQVQEQTHICHGPFLYTSVWNNRNVINCAIYKQMGATCRRLLRTSQTQMVETKFVWKAHPDGPSKDEKETEKPTPVTNTVTSTVGRTVTSAKAVRRSRPRSTSRSTSRIVSGPTPFRL